MNPPAASYHASSASASSSSSDLVRDARLQTTFHPDCRRPELTRHVYIDSDRSRRQRRVRIEEAWQRQAELGRGTFGAVYLERCVEGPKTGQLRAIKEIPKNHDAAPRIDYTRELEAVLKFSHGKYVSCFVQSHGWFEHDDSVFISMEFMENGDLQRYLGSPLPEADAREIAAQLVEGITFMHDNGFAHRDLKPQNILVVEPGPEWWVKIGDFGISKRLVESTMLETRVGTPAYLAPELTHLRDSFDSEQLSYTVAVDVWALGQIIHRMLCKRMAFDESGPNSLYNYVVRGNPLSTAALEQRGASADCCDFLRRTLVAHPSGRQTAREAKEHKWIRAALEAENEQDVAMDIGRRNELSSTPSAAGPWPQTPQSHLTEAIPSRNRAQSPAQPSNDTATASWTEFSTETARRSTPVQPTQAPTRPHIPSPNPVAIPHPWSRESQPWLQPPTGINAPRAGTPADAGVDEATARWTDLPTPNTYASPGPRRLSPGPSTLASMSPPAPSGHVVLPFRGANPSRSREGGVSVTATEETIAPPRNRLAQRLAELFPPPHDLMTSETWPASLDIGRSRQKWIMTNFQALDKFRCQALNRDIWKDTAVRRLVQENFVFLQLVKVKPEDVSPWTGVAFPQGVRDTHPDTYPLVTIVNPHTEAVTKFWSNPFPTADEFAAQLTQFLEDNSLAAPDDMPGELFPSSVGSGIAGPLTVPSTSERKPGAIKNLKKQVIDLERDPSSLYSAWPANNDLFHWIATIMGPRDTPYHDGIFHLDIIFPGNFPFSAPRIKFVTPVYHPNINSDGDISVDILMHGWTPALARIGSLLVSLCSLLDDPNPDNPLVPEIAHVYKTNRAEYDAIVRKWTRRYAK